MMTSMDLLRGLHWTIGPRRLVWMMALSVMGCASIAYAEGGWSLKGKRIALITFTTVGESGYEGAAESVLEQVLRDNGADVLDRVRATELRNRYGKAADPDYVMLADDFLKDASDYAFDVMLRCYVLNESRNALGGFTSATAQVVLQLVDAEAHVLGGARSPALGAPGFPPSDGMTSSAAVVNAVQRAAAGACEELGLRVLAPPVPRRLSFSIGEAADVPVGDGVVCIAPHPLLPRVVVGRTSGEISEYPLSGTRGVLSKRLGTAGIVWVGYSSHPRKLVAVDESGVIHEVGEDFAWSESMVSGIGKPMSACVSADGRSVILLNRQGRGAVVTLGAKTARPFSVSASQRLLGVAIGNDPAVAYVISEDGVRELRFFGDSVPSLGREMVGTATGETWSQATLQQGVVSPDGGLLAAAILTMDIDLLRGRRTDRVDVRLVDVHSGKVFASMKPGQYVGLSPKDVTALAFGPDWRFMAASSRENVVRVWNTESGQQQFEFASGMTRAITQLASGNSGRMLVGLATGMVRHWSLVSDSR